MRPLDIEFVRRRLRGRPIVHFDSIDSTMREAARLAARNCTPGTVVVAEEQTAGQGRHGHQWYSEIGSGLYLSVVLRPTLPADSLAALTLTLGLATAEAISQTTGLATDLRWPNDVMIGRRKAAGILVQLQDQVCIAGIGINVNHAAFPEDLAGEATSLRIESGRSFSREELLVTLLQSIDSFCRMLVEGGREAIIDVFCRVSTYARGKRVRVSQDGRTIEGTTAGLDPAGYLLVRKDDGAREIVLVGGVREI